MKNLEKKLQKAAKYILENTSFQPKIGVILGSGLGSYGDSLENADYIPYESIPHFPVSTVEGHKGRFVITNKVICMQGRFHYYEGYDMTEVTFPIRVMKLLGVQTLIVTNASGGINEAFSGGDLMLITDHINLMGANPLFGKNLGSFGARFPDMSECYDKELMETAKEIANKLEITLQQGIYIGMTGPSFETPAEIRMAKIMGADAVGMSTVPEVIVAVHSGIRVLGISCIANMAAGVQETPLCHEEVLEAIEQNKDKFIQLVAGIINKL